MFNVYKYNDIDGVYYHVSHTSINSHHVELEICVSYDENGSIWSTYDSHNNRYTLTVASDSFGGANIDADLKELYEMATDGGESGYTICAMLDMLRIVINYD